MGGRSGGRKPKPTVIKAMTGNPGHRALNADEPIPENDLDEEPPAHFSEAQGVVWREVLAEAPIGMLKTLDRAILEAYCINVALIEEMNNKIQQSGTLARGALGNPVVSPYVRIMTTATQMVIKCASELGFTPSSRSRIKVDKPKENTNPFGAFSAPPQAPALSS